MFMDSDWQSANYFGRPGQIAVKPRILIGFNGNIWRDWTIDDKYLLDGLARENSVPLAEYDNWMHQHAQDSVTVAIKYGENLTVTTYTINDFLTSCP